MAVPGPYNLRFVCTGNATRSIMAEATLHGRVFTLCDSAAKLVAPVGPASRWSPTEAFPIRAIPSAHANRSSEPSGRYFRSSIAGWVSFDRSRLRLYDNVAIQKELDRIGRG